MKFQFIVAKSELLTIKIGNVFRNLVPDHLSSIHFQVNGLNISCGSLTCRFCSSRVLSAAQICFGKNPKLLILWI